MFPENPDDIEIIEPDITNPDDFIVFEQQSKDCPCCQGLIERCDGKFFEQKCKDLPYCYCVVLRDHDMEIPKAKKKK